MNHWPLPALESASRDLLAPVRKRLTAFCRARETHARFLNTLSLMEHIGSRKIMATHSGASGASLSNDTLKHLAEETRHAFFFKRAAEKLARRPLDYGVADTIAGAAARAYMGRLDAAIASAMAGAASASLPYLYMSLIVELRAIWLYRLYRDVLANHEPGIALNSVVAEEELHLSAMLAGLAEQDASAPHRIAAFAGFEDRRFRKLWSAIEGAWEAKREAAK